MILRNLHNWSKSKATPTTQYHKNPPSKERHFSDTLREQRSNQPIHCNSSYLNPRRSVIKRFLPNIRHRRILFLLLLLLLTLSCFQIVVFTLNFHGIILWYPYVDILRIIKNKCYDNSSTKTKNHFTKNSKISNWVVPSLENNNKLPLYILNGRSNNVSTKILQPLKLHHWNYTIYTPKKSSSSNNVQQYSSSSSSTITQWECAVVKSHKETLQQAFISNPSSKYVLIIEDDAYLSNNNNLLYAIKYFDYYELPYYSLSHTTSTTYYNAKDKKQKVSLSCTDYKYLTVAYLIRYDFYKQVIHTCLNRCDRPLDICLSKMYAMEQVPYEVFIHGILPSTRPKSIY